MTTRETELEDFKTLIDLEAYAEAQGYVSDTRARSSTSRTMKHPNGDKIIIGMAAHDRHWIFCSIGDLTDNGSIIDLVQNRRGFNLGQVRKELRPWLNNPPAPAAASRDRDPLRPAVIDLPAVRAAYAAAEPVLGHHPYLTDVRGIPADLLGSERLAGIVRTDPMGAALFGHFNLERKVCGFEKKNRGFTGFSKGGQKGVWGSRKKDGDDTLAVTETGIDALSYLALHGTDRMRVASTGGALNPLQPGILNQMIRQLPQGGRVIAAVDHDDGGHAIAETLRTIYESVVSQSGRQDLAFRVHQPDTPGCDWNDVLKPAAAGSPPTPGPG